MARMLAIEWDGREARYVVGSGSRGGAVRVEQAGTIPLPPLAEGENRSAAELGETLRSALSEAKVRVTNPLVGIHRTAVELRQLSLPPAPEDELPELVRHQAAREFATAGDGAALDFVLAPSDSPTARVVTAVALPEPQLVFAQGVCEEAKLKPTRFLLHPYSAGSLLIRRGVEPIVLLVDGGEDETDLTVLVDGRVFLCRTVRNQTRTAEENEAGDAATESSTLAGEIRRTVIAAKNQAGGGSVDAIYVCGDGASERELIRRLQEELLLPVHAFDPWSSADVNGLEAGASPPNPGRFAALLGMLADEASERQTGFDFLNPRRKPEPVNRRRMALAAAAAVLVAAGVGLYFAWEQFDEIGDRIRTLEKRSRDLDQLVKRGGEKQAVVAAIEDWSLGDVIWLDELRDLSLRFPQPRDAVLLRLTLAARPTGGGSAELEGLVRDPSIVGRMESQLRDEYHEIRTRRVQESVQGKTNTWKFDSSLSVSRRSKDDYLAYQSDSPRTTLPAPATTVQPKTVQPATPQPKTAQPKTPQPPAAETQPAPSKNGGAAISPAEPPSPASAGGAR